MNTDDTCDDPQTVASRNDLSAFIDRMARELQEHPERWENATLPRFLEALSRYLTDVPGWCKNVAPHIDPDKPEWSLFAIVLAGATVYE